jgi:hypothetical protein
MESLSFDSYSYRHLLKAGLDSGYRFLPFDATTLHTAERTCLLRHDIDADMEAALRMARMEAELGVLATYFFMLRSPMYNLFGRANWRMAREIISLGHYAGLHFDQGFRPGEHLDWRAWIALEADILQKTLNVPVKAVSFHQPGPEVLNGKIDTGHLINTYSKEHLPGFEYLSDSNREWRASNPLQVFREGRIDRLQLLIHPMWWIHEKSRTTADVWNAVIIGNFERSQIQLLETERGYGPKRRMMLSGGEDDQ